MYIKQLARGRCKRRHRRAVRFPTRAKQFARSFRISSKRKPPLWGRFALAVRNAGIGPAISAWEANVMPLN